MYYFMENTYNTKINVNWSFFKLLIEAQVLFILERFLLYIFKWCN